MKTSQDNIDAPWILKILIRCIDVAKKVDATKVRLYGYAIYDSQYKPALFNRIGFVNIPELIEKTEQDINIATNWKPGTIKEYR